MYCTIERQYFRLKTKSYRPVTGVVRDKVQTTKHTAKAPTIFGVTVVGAF